MAPQNTQKWLTLIGHCFAMFSNAIGFGIYFTHLDIFAQYYNISEESISNSFFIGLTLELVFCIPALKLIEWRLDYSLMCGAFLSMTSYWVEYLAEGNFIVGITIITQSSVACSSNHSDRRSCYQCRPTWLNDGSLCSKDPSPSLYLFTAIFSDSHSDQFSHHSTSHQPITLLRK